MLWLLVNGSGWASACCRTLYSRLHVFILSMSKYTCCSAIYLCVCESEKSTLKKKQAIERQHQQQQKKKSNYKNCFQQWLMNKKHLL